MIPWKDLREAFENRVAKSSLQWVGMGEAHSEGQHRFALGRLEEGIALARYFENDHPETRSGDRTLLSVLDIGAGNGGVSLGLANDRRFHVTALDTFPNYELTGLRRAVPAGIRQIVAVGEALPFAASSFDIVLLLETIEHVARPRMLGAEIMRVLRPGGVCMITTPQRLRYLFRPDPHFGVRNLFLLPDALQRLFVTRFARRGFGGRQAAGGGYYDVDHIYWHARGITARFPEPRSVTVYHLPGFEPTGKLLRALKRKAFGGFFWDRILIYKLDSA